MQLMRPSYIDLSKPIWLSYVINEKFSFVLCTGHMFAWMKLIALELSEIQGEAFANFSELIRMIST